MNEIELALKYLEEHCSCDNDVGYVCPECHIFKVLDKAKQALVTAEKIIAIQEEALKFYAVDASKSMSGDFRSYAMFIEDDVDEMRVGRDFILIKKGGKRARTTLKEVEELRGKNE